MAQGGMFVDKQGALMREVAGPGSLVPLRKALFAAFRAAKKAGVKSGSLTLPIAFAPSGEVGGPVRPFVTTEQLGLHKLTLHFSRGEKPAAESPKEERGSRPTRRNTSR